MPMRVLFLEIEHEQAWSLASVGPAYIGAALRAAGHQVELRRVPFEAAPEGLSAALAEHPPELIGLSLTTRQWLRARSVVAALRAELDVPVIAGGLHPTFAPQQVLEASGFDFACIGEGEQAMLELVAALERGVARERIDLANVWRRGGPRPRLRAPVEDLDTLPFAARDLLDERYGVVHLSTQRGCPFPCSYCAAQPIAQLYPGGYRAYGRRRSPQHVLAELDTLRAAGAVNYVVFLDDTFTLDARWLRAFCSEYAARCAIPFSINARAETVSQAMLERLAAAGCRHVIYGVESGSERVRREVLNRRVSNQRLRDVFRWTREAGLLATANYMLGLPGETRAEVEQTLALHADLAPDDFGHFVFYPYPGTALFELCRARGYLPPDYRDRPANHRETILHLPDLSAEDVRTLYARFTSLRQHEHARRCDDPGNGAEAARRIAASAACG